MFNGMVLFFMLLVFFVFAIPFLWLFFGGFRPQKDLFAFLYPFQWHTLFPKIWTFDNYLQAIEDGFGRNVLNSAIIVTMRSRRRSMVRVAMTAGTAHAKPLSIGTKARPCRPSLRMTRSIRKAARARYPESSRMMMNRNRIRICGRKTITLPTPAITPSVRKLAKALSGSRKKTRAMIPGKASSLRRNFLYDMFFLRFIAIQSLSSITASSV